MSQPNASPSTSAESRDYDAVIVGASLGGCATAMLLGRAGARVALVERSPRPDAFKRICSHFIQASAIPTLERLGLLEPILAAGGLETRLRAWTRWGWIEAPEESAGVAVNLRREVLDPMVREAAAGTPGVELLMGRTAEALLREGAAFSGVRVRDRDGNESELRGRLVVGADGRDSRVAELSGVSEKVLPHGRFAYGGYFEGGAPTWAPTSAIWMLDPDWAAAFPTDSGLTFYAAMPVKERLPEFKDDPEAALVETVAAVPDAPPIRSGRLVSPILGKVEMPNRMRRPTADRLALVGDAALATDPLFGVGCGWALQSAEWLADSVAPALEGSESLEVGLERYRRRHARELGGHAFLIHGYATGRPLDPFERLLFSSAARDPKVAAAFDELGTRRQRPQRILPRILPRAIAVNARHALARRRTAGAGAASSVGVAGH